MRFRKGDLVRIVGDPSREIAFVVKGPYESAFREFGHTHIVIVYDVYCAGRIIPCLPYTSLERIAQEGDEAQPETSKD